MMVMSCGADWCRVSHHFFFRRLFMANNICPLPTDNAFEAYCEFVQDIFTMPERQNRIVQLAHGNGLYINMIMVMVGPYFANENITSYDHSDVAFDRVFEYLKACAEEEGLSLIHI